MTHALWMFWGYLLVIFLSFSSVESFQVKLNRRTHSSSTPTSIGAPPRTPLSSSATSSIEPVDVKVNNARSVAIQSILRATPSKSAITQMEKSSDFQSLPVRDKAFCRTLITAVERRKGQVNAILEYCKNNKTIKKRNIDRLVDATLQVGLVQLLYLNTTSFAAVKETVDTLKQHSTIITEKQIGYANAILRRISREGDTLGALFANVQLNAAPWLVEELQRDWGEATTILEHAMMESPRTLTVRHDNNAHHIASLFDEAVVLPQGSVRVVQPPPGPLSVWPLYSEGQWWCQDPSATLPALAIQSSVMKEQQKQQNEAASTHVIDLCAAPGGKTAQLLNMGYQVTAVEISEKRVHTLRQNLARLKFHEGCEIVVADATSWIPKEPVKYVLLDAPCSATGTASKRPDVLWKESTSEQLLNTQYALLEHALDNMLQDDGILVYATCSLLKRESEDQIAKLLNERGPDVEIVPFRDEEIPGIGKKYITPEGNIRILPTPLMDSVSSEFCGDGFFVSRLRKLGRSQSI